MKSLFANRFSMTTNERKETFLIFYLDVPEYDLEGKYVGMKTEEQQMIILTEEAYDSLRSMMDEAEKKEENSNESKDQ